MFAGYMRDITERRRAEAALAEYTRDLEQAHNTERQNAEQLATLVDQLRETQRQAEAATRAKSEFLASMSHELRTPLNAIILYSELLQEEAEDEGHQRSIADLQRIQSAGKHLLDLINDILDLSKIEAGKMALSLETFDVRAMIDELLDTVGPLVEVNNNILTVHCSADVGQMSADLMKTRQILLNLLSNAGKFTRAGAITLEVRRRTVGGTASVEFTVTDTGVGMTAAGDREDLRRVHASGRDDDPQIRRHRAGARDRVALLPADGRVRVGREPPWNGLMLHRPPAPGRDRGVGRITPGRRCVVKAMDGGTMATILVVEDNEPSRDVLSRRLERRGYRVLLAADGQQAVSVAHAAQPDLILMDLGLPGIDGWEATRQLKGGRGDAAHPDHRAERPRDDERSRHGARRGRRRVRYEARPVPAVAGENRIASGEGRWRPMTRQGSLLIVDDSEPNRDALSRRLAHQGFLVDDRRRWRRSAGARRQPRVRPRAAGCRDAGHERA